MNREPSLIDLSTEREHACSGVAGARPGPGPLPPVPALAQKEVTFPPNMAARRKCAAYLSGRLRRRSERNARTRMRRYRYPQKAVGGRGASRRGIAHANCFPAAGRLMRAGRAGAGGGSDARAHLGPSLSAGALAGRSERDGDTSLSQCRLVNTNRPKSRDKIFDLHYVHAHERTSVSTDAHMRTRLANCLLVAAHRCATFDNFSRKLTCSVAVDKARLATWL